MLSNPLSVHKEFDHSMIGEHRIKGNKIYMEIKKEDITSINGLHFDYNIHFHFCLENHSDKMINCNFFIDCDEESDINRGFNTIWVRNESNSQYEKMKIDGKMSSLHPMKFKFNYKIAPKSKDWIANYLPIDYLKIMSEIDTISDEIGMKKTSIGKSIEKQSIFSYELGDVENKPTLMFISGFHPPEADYIAIKSILSKIATHDLDKLLKKYSLSFIPFINPDGLKNDLQGSNINGVNFHWKFDVDDESSPESKYIWEYCKKVKPVFYLDFHSFTFWDMLSRPYKIPHQLYSNGKSRIVQQKINRKLRKLCQGRYAMAEKIFHKKILSAKLRSEMGTIISPKFHIDMKDGIDKCEILSSEVFIEILTIFNEYFISDEMIKEPFGKMKENSIDKILISFYFIYLTKIRPILGKIKRTIWS